jgi:pyruvate dehydrogenase E2 component (dihydrolipoamide acetyltransferase)
MIKEIKMPDLGTTIKEMKIVKWLKSEGDKINRGEPIFEVETDKATMEVESYLEGYLKKIVSGSGEMVNTGATVAFIGDKDDRLPDILPDKNKLAGDKVEKPVTNIKEKSGVKISPMIKRLAEKHGVDINKIKGSGPGGLILKEDIISAAGAGISETSGKAGRDLEVVPFNRIGAATAKKMAISKTKIPHIYITVDVDAGSMKELHTSSGKKYSYNTMIVYGVARTLKDYPYMSARYDEKGRQMVKDINIGLAVAKGEDLLVPVIKKITDNKKELTRIESDIRRLVKKIESGSYDQEDISGGVFTVTNLGAYGISSFAAIINPPEAAILAVGAIQDRAVAKGGNVAIRPIVTMTLSVDHRIVNGAYAASFLQKLKSYLES